MIYIKNRDEIERIRESNQIVAETLLFIKKYVKPGVSTGDLNKEIENFILKKKAKPAFKGLYGFPASSCISVQDEVVHGIPSFKRYLKEGEIVGIDIGVEQGGFYGDAAFTFAVGKIDDKSKKLLTVTEESLYLGIKQMIADNRVGSIGNAIQVHVEKNKYNVVRDLVGHGVGRKPHEEPQIPNYGQANKGALLRTGMVLAIEPMVNMGRYEVYFADDEWTVKTADGLPSAHFEHSVAITENGPDILSNLKVE
jgi:methionyl aminopeptidase